MRNLLKVTSKLHLNICQHFQSYAYTVPLNHQHRKLYMDFQSLQVTRDHEVQSTGWNTGFLKLNPRKVIVVGERSLGRELTSHPMQLNSGHQQEGLSPSPARTGCASFTSGLQTAMPEGERQPPLAGREPQERAASWRRISRSQGWP